MFIINRLITESTLMKYVRGFFKQFDMFPAPATLRAREDSQTTSFCAGVLSFIAVGLFTYLFISNIVAIVQYEQISSTQTQTKLLGDQVSADNLLFAIMVNYENATEVVKYFSISVTAFAIDNIYNIQLAVCTADQWLALGDNYVSIFQEYGLGSFLCPTSTENLDLQGTFKKTRIKEIKITVQPCGFSNTPTNTTTNTTTNSSTSTTSTCKTVAEQEAYLNSSIAKSRTLMAELYFLDQSINASAEDPVTYFVNNDNRVSFTSKRGVDNTVEFASFQITTDTSLLPYTDNQVVSGNFVDKLKDSTFEIESFGSNPFVVFQLIMNRKMVYVQRTVGKIDEALSYVGGLFSIIIAFLAVFMMNYNQYRYELMVAEGSFNFDEDGKKVREDDFHFHTYVKYSIYGWIKDLFCVELNWQQCQEIDQTREEANCQMDVVRLFRKIRNLETAVLYLMSQKEKMCLTLFEPPALPQVRRNRLITEYYEAVIEGKPAATVEDIRMVGNTFRLGFRLAKQKEMTAGIVEKGSQSEILQFGNSNQAREMIDANSNYQTTIKLAEDRSNILDVVLNNFPQYRKQAEEVELPAELQSIEIQLAKGFFGLQPKVRAKIQQKIPLKIIHRLKLRMDQLNAQTEFKINLEI